jgi:hypothetical protein
MDTFSVKHNAKDIVDPELIKENQNINSSYKYVVHNISNGSRHPLLLSIVNPKDSKDQKVIL